MHDHLTLQQQLDRLADGELSLQEQRELFRHLDAIPDGWRRCALALLEAQAWQQELKAVVDQPGSPKLPAPAPASATRTRSWTGQMWSVTAAAVCLVLGFVLGQSNLWQGPKVPEAPSSPSSVAQSSPLPSSSEQETNTGQESMPDSSWGAWAWQEPGPEGQPVQRVVADPLLVEPDGPPLLPQQLFPSDVLRALKALGHEVQVRRRWRRVITNEGTQVFVPGYEVRVFPVSDPQFQ